MIAENDGPFKHHLDRYKYPERHATDPIKHRAAGLALLTGLAARLAGRANLCRDSRSLTDITIMPFVRQFAMAENGRESFWEGVCHDVSIAGVAVSYKKNK